MKISQACGEMIKETSLKDAENKTKLQMLAALKGRLEACNGKLAKLFAQSRVIILFTLMFGNQVSLLSDMNVHHSIRLLLMQV